MNDNEKTTGTTVEPEVKQRGNPNWIKKAKEETTAHPIKRAEVLSEMRAITDRWEVRNKDPKMHYVWGHKDSDEEMNEFAQKSYAPARGREQIMGNPFEAKVDDEGKTKERGNRILMCCLKTEYDARNVKRASKYVGAKKAAESDARKMMSGKKGVVVEANASTETRREGLAEET